MTCEDEKHWRDLAYCLAQLSCTDKGLKKLIELFPKYQHALGDEEVVEHFKAIVAKVDTALHFSSGQRSATSPR